MNMTTINDATLLRNAIIKTSNVLQLWRHIEVRPEVKEIETEYGVMTPYKIGVNYNVSAELVEDGLLSALNQSRDEAIYKMAAKIDSDHRDIVLPDRVKSTEVIRFANVRVNVRTQYMPEDDSYSLRLTFTCLSLVHVTDSAT